MSLEAATVGLVFASTMTACIHIGQEQQANEPMSLDARLDIRWLVTSRGA